MKTEAEMNVMLPQAKEHLEPPEPRIGRNNSPLEPSKKEKPCQ